MKKHHKIEIIFIKCLTTLAWILSVSLLTSCERSSNNAETYFDTYLSRLARVLEQPAPKLIPEFNRSTPLPRTRDRQWPPPPPIETSLFSWLKIAECPTLEKWLAFRNSQLGRVMQPPIAQHYAFKIRASLQSCIMSSDASSMKKELSELLRLKITANDHDLWQTLFGHNWFSTFASEATYPVAWEERSSLIASTQTFSLYNQLVGALNVGEYQHVLASEQHITNAFRNIDGHTTLGSLLQSIKLVTTYLDIGTQIVEQVKPHQYCPPGTQRRTVDFFQNLVVQYFGQTLQPYISHLSRDGGEMLTEINTLLQQFPTHEGITPYWQNVYATRTSIWQQYNRSVKGHAKALSQLLEACNKGFNQK